MLNRNSTRWVSDPSLSFICQASASLCRCTGEKGQKTNKQMNKNRKEKYPRGIKAYAEPEWNQKMEGCTNLFTISLLSFVRREERANQQPWIVVYNRDMNWTPQEEHSLLQASQSKLSRELTLSRCWVWTWRTSKQDWGIPTLSTCSNPLIAWPTKAILFISKFSSYFWRPCLNVLGTRLHASPDCKQLRSLGLTP